MRFCAVSIGKARTTLWIGLVSVLLAACGGDSTDKGAEERKKTPAGATEKTGILYPVFTQVADADETLVLVTIDNPPEGMQPATISLALEDSAVTLTQTFVGGTALFRLKELPEILQFSLKDNHGAVTQHTWTPGS